MRGIEVSAVNHPKKERKLVPDLYTVKRVIVFRNGRIHEDSGAINKIPPKWMTVALVSVSEMDGRASRRAQSSFIYAKAVG